MSCTRPARRPVPRLDDAWCTSPAGRTGLCASSATLSLLSGDVRADRLLASSQVTDTYLLALAASAGARLATFDAKLVTDAVPDGEKGLLVTP